MMQTLIDLKVETDSNTSHIGTLTSHLQQWTDYPDRKSGRKHWP